MSWKTQSLFWLLPCAFGPFLAGCGSEKMPTAPVQGKVTWQGRPLIDGKVMFDPVKIAEGLPARPAIAEIGTDGVYRASSFRVNDGLLPGEYRVTVYSYTSRPTLENPNRPYVWRIPPRYGDSTQSGLSFTVPANAHGPLVFDINIQ